MENTINWNNVSADFRELRRNIGQAAIATRKSTAMNQPAAKRRRVDSDLDITLCEDKFPPIDNDLDSLNDPARFMVDVVHAKIFIGAVFTFSKFSDSVLLFPTREGLTIKTCNMSKTAAGTFNFSLEFFSAVHTFEFPTEKPCCRLFLKPFLTVLKKTESMKQLENFVIDMDPNSETMVFRVQLRNGIKSLYKLPLTDVFANSMPSIIRRDDSSNTIVLMARQLLDAFEVAGKEGSEIALWASDQDIIFHTLFQLTNVVQKYRNAAVRVTDHINVKIRKLVNLSFSVRDIRALSKFADKYNSSVSLHFKAAKSPLFAVVEIPGLCEATFTVSTSPITGTNLQHVIEKMIPEAAVDISPATQLNPNQEVTGTLSANNNAPSQFQPVEIDQSHELIAPFVNTQPSSYWEQALAIRSLEIIEVS